jgi:hypothetical protein
MDLRLDCRDLAIMTKSQAEAWPSNSEIGHHAPGSLPGQALAHWRMQERYLLRSIKARTLSSRSGPGHAFTDDDQPIIGLILSAIFRREWNTTSSWRRKPWKTYEC